MKRALEKELIEWKNRADRKPLLIRGARQVGKTYLVESFAQQYFESSITINFEEMKEARLAFEGNLTPSYILRDLSTRLNKPIVPGQTLIFFDEIQACPNALLSLRFFKEQMPELHIIGAGSLLEFIMGDERFSFPVGRIEYLYLRPLSFDEFLEAKNEQSALAWIKEANPLRPLGAATHTNLLTYIKEYFTVGGMPEAVADFVKTGQFLGLDRIHQNIINAYQSDLGKYPRNSQQKFMRLLFEAAPRLIAEHFKYSKIQPHAQSRDYMESLEVLTRTGILHQVFATSASSIPLSTNRNDKKFKLLFLDIGLVPKATNPILLNEDPTLINGGDLAEQFVGQELIAYGRPYAPQILYYWEKEKAGSAAEVDYVMQIGSQIVPIEVKSGPKGRLKSLRVFMDEKNAPLGVRVSQAPLSFEKNLLSVPLYMIAEIPRLVLESINS